MPNDCASISRRWTLRISGASLPELLLSIALLSLAAAPAAGQAQGVAAGRILRLAGKDSIPASGARVVLHRVGHDRQGPIDSLPADRRGRFRFRYTGDTAAVYLVSARFGGIEYFSPPLKINAARPDTDLVLLVSDTSSTVAVTLTDMHFVISQPEADGTRGVLTIAGLSNVSDRTRVSGDSLTPTWAASIPAGITNFRAGQGDFSPEALAIRSDSALLFAPIAPGAKQVVWSYSVPSGQSTLVVPFAGPVPVVNVLLEDMDATVGGGTLAAADTQIVEGRSFRRWSGAIAGAGTIRIIFPGPNRLRWALPVLVTVIGVVLALATWRTAVRAGGRSPAPVEDLVGAIAMLDARYLGREAEVPAAEWREYQEERGRLVARARLARPVGRA
jgi:hypothetical protein